LGLPLSAFICDFSGKSLKRGQETVSGLFSEELSSEKMPRREDQNVQMKRVGWITP